jgi:peptidyl-prolyl cis-trans isomerase D
VNKIGSAFGAILVIAIIIVFIIQFQAASPTRVRSDTGPQCAVEVRGSCISKASFTAAARLVGSGNRQQAKGYGNRIADGLIEAWLLNQDAARLGISVGDDDVTEEISRGRAHVSIPVSDIGTQVAYNYQLGPELVRQIPVKNPKTKKFDAKYTEKQIRYFSQMSPTDFREYQRSEMVAARMRDLIKARVRVGENEAFDVFSQEKSTITLDYVRFDRRFYADLVVDMSQRAVDFWADGHKEDIDKAWEARKTQVLPECRSVREIFVKLPEAATDDEKAAGRARIDRARSRIVLDGEDFADVARSVSEGGTAARGGELGCLLKGRAPKPLEEAVAALAPGKLSDVVTTDAGFYLVKLDQVAKDADAEKLGRAQTARELYLGHEADRLAVEAAKKVAAAVKGGKPLKEALDLYLAELPKPEPPKDKKDTKAKKDKKADDKQKSAPPSSGSGHEADRPAYTTATHPNRPILETTLPFNVNGDPIPGVHQTSELTRIAFSLEKPGDAPSDTIGFENGYLAIQLKEKKAASKEQWEKDKEFYIRTKLLPAKAHEALVAYVKRLHAQLATDVKKTASIVDDKVQKGEQDAPLPEDDGE